MVVTTCSANHLAQAKSFGDSLIKHNPDYTLMIGLVDKLEGRVTPDYYYPYQIVEAESLQIPQFGEMFKRYTTLELNCALKSFFVQYALDTHQPDIIFFLDTDILVFDPFQFLEQELLTHSILITPHITKPFPQDDLKPQEKDILKTGIYNAGFFALRNDNIGRALMNWWKERMIDQCYERPKEGLNVDQNWLNFVPLYFERVKIISHSGCNIAYWNFHERSVTKQKEKYFVNDLPLVFFHYSGYSIKNPDQVSKHQNRYDFKNKKELKELFDLYHTTLINNGHEKMLTLKCYYQKSNNKILKKLFPKK